MNLSLTRCHWDIDGIFGELHSEQSHLICETLEHAYLHGDTYFAKIPPGGYICKRSQHRLHGMQEDFETFEVMGVPGHTGLLFHWGNFNRDSEGCILLGEAIKITEDKEEMLTNSRRAFASFMALQDGSDEFTLIVS